MKMLEKIYAFFGIQTKASRRQQRNRLLCRLWYVHNKDLSEAFGGSEFLDDIIRTKRNIVKGQK